jgi:glycosyltransferase involved in cell wall biosynthesis
MTTNQQNSLLHVLYSPRVEGCPRLALDLIDQERLQTGQRASVAFLTAEPDDLLSEFEARCAGVYHLGWSRKGFISLAWRAWKLFRRVKPDGVVVYTLGQHLSIGAAAKLLNIPTIVHVGNAPPAVPAARRKLRLVMSLGAPLVRMHVACSDVIADVCRNVYHLRRVLSVPNGINLARFTAVREERGAEQAKHPRIIGMIASLAQHKDQALLIRAIAVLQARDTPVGLVLAGAGDQEGRLKSLAQELGVMARIDWLGNVSDVRTVLRRLDVFAFATTPSEGLGIALVEALAAGLPVVASDVPACREVLEGGRWGRLVPGDDPEAWADALVSQKPLGMPPIEALTRYDISDTWRRYRRSLGVDALVGTDG